MNKIKTKRDIVEMAHLVNLIECYEALSAKLRGLATVHCR